VLCTDERRRDRRRASCHADVDHGADTDDTRDGRRASDADVGSDVHDVELSRKA
jgi:hypothetical protein